MVPKRTKSEYFQLSHDDRIVIKKLEILTQAVEKIYPSQKTLLWRSFLQGLFFAIGSTLGLSVILAIITYFLVQVKQIPLLNTIIQ